MGRGRNADATGQKRYKYVGSEYENSVSYYPRHPSSAYRSQSELFFWNSRSTMCLIRILSLYTVLAMGLGEKDYTFESGRQVNFGIGFRE